MTKRQYTKWTKDMVSEIAAKYKSLGAFQDEDNRAYMAAWRNGWLKEVCAHMFSARFVWKDDMIATEALKYKTRSDFAKGSRAAYSAAARLKILDEVCKHMPRYSGKGVKRGPNRRTTKKETTAYQAKASMAKMMGL